MILTDDVVANATRAVCTRNIGGYCDCFGESIGCKVGRGEPPEISRCKMTDEALSLTVEYVIARAALEAARYGEIRECLKRLATTEQDGFSHSVAIAEARALLSTIGAV